MGAGVHRRAGKLTRWYLKRDGAQVFLVVERLSDTQGFRVPVDSRHTARNYLPKLLEMVHDIGRRPDPVGRFDPVEA